MTRQADTYKQLFDKIAEHGSEVIEDLNVSGMVKNHRLARALSDIGIYEMRRHFSNYFKGLPNFKETRIKLLTTLEVDEIFSILEGIKTSYGDFRPENSGSFWDKLIN